MTNDICCATNDAESHQTDETHSHMQPVVVLETLNLTR